MSTVKSRISLGLGWLGFAAHLAMVVWYLASRLLAPAWAVVLLMGIWVGMTVVAWRFVRSDKPLWTLAVPVIDATVWLVVITSGEEFLGWTA